MICFPPSVWLVNKEHLILWCYYIHQTTWNFDPPISTLSIFFLHSLGFMFSGLWYLWICSVFMVNTSICILWFLCITERSSDGALSSLVLGPSAAERTSDLFVNWTKHTSTHAEPSLYTKTIQKCLLFLVILCNKSTLNLYPFLMVVHLKMSCSLPFGNVIWWDTHSLNLIRIISKI